MFKTIEIEHFRGIRHAKIDGLKEVNIFLERIIAASLRYLTPSF